MSEKSILDTILTKRHAEDIRSFNPVLVVKKLANQLSEREQEVVFRRFGLPNGTNTETLEEIGEKLRVTRERVRQITKSTVKKMSDLAVNDPEVKSFLGTIEQLLRSYGGALEEEYFVDRLMDFVEIDGQNNDKHAARTCLIFLLNEVLSNYIEHRAPKGVLRSVYLLPGTSLTTVEEVVTEFVSLIQQQNNPLDSQALLDKFHQSEYYKTHGHALVADAVNVAREFHGTGVTGEPTEEEESRVLLAYLRASAVLAQNAFGEWGIEKWATITPKRMNDKIYLILRKEGEPLHFTVISERVNEAKFDKKIAKPPSIHNELILDKRFVLVGRGTYALKEWGYQPGTVAEVIAQLLRDKGSLTRDEIVKAVLEERVVKKQTIHLALLNHQQFEKQADGKYNLVGTPITA